MTEQEEILTPLLRHLLESVYEHAATTAIYTDPDVPTRHFESVTEFWKMIEETDDATPEVQYVSLRGALSTFAPALPGIPWLKRDVHREVRRGYERMREQLAQDGRPVASSTLDSLLGFSAGQMVVRVDPANLQYVYLGLYHSIVRNSIPVFVRREYYEEAIAPALSAVESQAMEAFVSARLKPLTEHYVAEFVESVGLYELFDAQTLEKVAPRYGLEVDGDDEHTFVVTDGPTRYLDGDIWVAVRKDGIERVVSRFINLADPADVRCEREGLKRDVGDLLGDSEVISEYDQVDRLFASPHVLDPKAIRQNLYRRRSAETPARPTDLQDVLDGILDRCRHDGPTILVGHLENLEAPMGDIIKFSHVGGNVNIKSRLDQVAQNIGSAASIPADQQAELQDLMRDLSRALEQIQGEKAEDAEKVAVAAERLSGEVARDKPDKRFLEVSAEGLKDAAEAVKGIAPTVVSTVGKILALLAI